MHILLNIYIYLKSINFFRYFESGYCKGFLNSALHTLKKYYPHVRNDSILPWRIYTDKDIHLYKLHKEAATGYKHFNLHLYIIAINNIIFLQFYIF